MYFSHILSVALLAVAPLVSAHCKIPAASGNKGGKGTALGIIGSAASANSQADVTILGATGFGRTAAGNINEANAFAAMLKLTGDTIPQVSAAKGFVTMTLHQVNADGAGPMSCSVNADASGKSFKPMTITTNVPGTNGRSKAANQNFPLVAKMPAGLKCTGTVGGVKNVCMVKCENPVGPFGGIVPVQQV